LPETEFKKGNECFEEKATKIKHVCECMTGGGHSKIVP
jgi:hypothetical protein